MCANIKVEGRVAIVEGVEALCGANVFSPDLRGGTSLVIAGLCAKGTTIVNNLSHIDRGCEYFAEHLSMLGAKIKREDCTTSYE
ncbi:UDP-N-acetylglucosamine 1-carboxyvinyltransferase [bioreactor metagenome]|uniref:UDP-N-acetylglucosamine 1-carboxyvinyltransferase n=1 Tax=bioreactor metagenome TaxID=1076179 RepID=A0A645D687_9ZZZZ